MNKHRQSFITALLLGVLVPGIILRSAVLVRNMYREEKPQTPTQTQGQVESEFRLPVLFSDGQIRPMELDTYLLGVVLQEMPGSFEPEAKKAQAVVARTYALRIFEKSQKHPGGAVCTDYHCCQAYVEPADYLEAGGSLQRVKEAREAVEQTHGMVLRYEGELIDATYFSCSGGYTEDAAAVWGADIPYLQSVESPGEEEATYHTDRVELSLEEFAEALSLTVPKDTDWWFGPVERTDGGGVAVMEIGDTLFTGTQLRTLLGLRSTAMTVSLSNGQVVITTRGYGHRVGMSQYGADAMAEKGHSFREILLHYYTGAVLETDPAAR